MKKLITIAAVVAALTACAPAPKNDWQSECEAHGWTPPVEQVELVAASGNVLIDEPGYRHHWVTAGAIDHVNGTYNGTLSGGKVYQKPFSWSECTFIGYAREIRNGTLYIEPAAGVYLPGKCPFGVATDSRY